MVVLDGTWCEKAGEFAWEGLGHLGTSEVGEALERLVRRMERHLRRCGLKKAYTDGTIAVDIDPLSLLCRLATSVPPPRLHTLRYTRVLAPAATGEPAILATNSSGVRFFKALCGRTVLTSTRERVFNQKWLEMRPPQVADLAQQEHAPADAAV